MSEEGGRKADLKIVLVGNAAVGKTAIVTRLVKGTCGVNSCESPTNHLQMQNPSRCLRAFIRRHI